mmetsp:Transcript_13864/g.50492  ORF Transcript_13864/g.50492 Transcript_13864/m.50492 type:complete len:231 (-) Transcript_13864:522-1214(-)
MSLSHLAAWYCSGVMGTFNWLGVGVSIPNPAGVAPMIPAGVAPPIIGVAPRPGVMPPESITGVSSQRDLWRLPVPGVAPMPGVAPPSSQEPIAGVAPTPGVSPPPNEGAGVSSQRFRLLPGASVAGVASHLERPEPTAGVASGASHSDLGCSGSPVASSFGLSHLFRFRPTLALSTTGSGGGMLMPEAFVGIAASWICAFCSASSFCLFAIFRYVSSRSLSNWFSRKRSA